MFNMLSFRLSLSLFLLVYVTCDDQAKEETPKKKHHEKLICHQCMCIDGTSDSPTEAFCGNNNFDQIPEITKEIHSTWKWQLSENDIKNISSFTHLKHLVSLSLVSNEISVIADNAFANLTALQELDLSHNKITYDTLSSKTFQGLNNDSTSAPLDNLKILNLSYNKLKRLPDDVFLPLTNLTSLDISHNPFKDFSLKTVTIFSELRALEILDISYTQLKRLPSHFFAEFHNLKELDLSGNYFATVPSEVNFIHNLNTLKINNNTFRSVKEDCFWGEMSSLETLYLSDSSTLLKIDKGAFSNLTGLKTLWLNNNPNLSMIHPRAFHGPDNYSMALENLYIQDNALTTLSKRLVKWVFLKRVDLQRNPWNCDCNFKWFATSYIKYLKRNVYELTANLKCNEPPEVKGRRMVEDRIQDMEFICVEVVDGTSQHSFILIATIVVGCLLLATGILFFLYIIMKKSPNDWAGENVKYRRAQSDENVSTILY